MKNWIHTPLAATLGGLAQAAKAPWWALLLFGMLYLGYAALRAVFPQESVHRLQWWQDRRALKAGQGQFERSRSSEAPPSKAGPAAPPTAKPWRKRRRNHSAPAPDRERPP